MEIFHILRNKKEEPFVWQKFKSYVNKTKINADYLHTELCSKTAKINRLCIIFTNFQ